MKKLIFFITKPPLYDEKHKTNLPKPVISTKYRLHIEFKTSTSFLPSCNKVSWQGRYVKPLRENGKHHREKGRANKGDYMENYPGLAFKFSTGVIY